jgi:hypothetical protein
VREGAARTKRRAPTFLESRRVRFTERDVYDRLDLRISNGVMRLSHHRILNGMFVHLRS